MVTHLTGGWSHIPGKHDYTAMDRFFFKNTKQSAQVRIWFCSWMYLTHFLIVFTPTLRSSEKNIKIWSDGFERDVV